jgi:competence protein ComEA
VSLQEKVIVFAAGAVLFVSVAIGYTSLFGQSKLTRPLSEFPGVVAGEQSGEFSLLTLPEDAAPPGGTEVAPAPLQDIEFPLDLNTATASGLETLPGIGPVLAGRILAYRAEIGGFATVEQLLEVSGIGEKKLDAVRDLVVVRK